MQGKLLCNRAANDSATNDYNIRLVDNRDPLITWLGAPASCHQGRDFCREDAISSALPTFNIKIMQAERFSGLSGEPFCCQSVIPQSSGVSLRL